jgi:hypothetical protein
MLSCGYSSSGILRLEWRENIPTVFQGARRVNSDRSFRVPHSLWHHENGFTTVKRKHWRLYLSMMGLILVALAYWWTHGGEYDLLVALQPEFQVSQIDRKTGTMTIGNASEAFLVRCADTCNAFEIGGKYSMLYRGTVMEYRRGGRTFQFPILQQHVNFDVVGGHG